MSVCFSENKSAYNQRITAVQAAPHSYRIAPSQNRPDRCKSDTGDALVAQLDRVPDFESGGCRFKLAERTTRCAGR